MAKIFLAKEKASNDRDVVKYIEFEGFVCDHYFSGLHIMGPCFCGFEKELREIVNNNFDSLETILTKEEFLKLFELNDKLDALGYGIEKDSDRYKEGLSIIQEYHDTIEKKLLSSENQLLFEKVEAEEKEWVKEEYGLSDEDVNIIFNSYTGEYSDRAIVSAIFKDFDEMVKEEKFNFGYDSQPYFDDKAFGEDLLEDNSYLELPSGKIVYYSY